MNRQQLFSELNERLQELFGDKLRKIILYGSYAKKRQTDESDIDFIVLVDDTEKNLRNYKYHIAEIMTELSLNYDILVSITEETYSRYEEYMEILPFFSSIRKEGVVIYGE